MGVAKAAEKQMKGKWEEEQRGRGKEEAKKSKEEAGEDKEEDAEDAAAGQA